MPDNVYKVTPVVSSSAGNDTSNATPPVAFVASVPSSVPAPSSSGAVRLPLVSPSLRP